VSDEELARLYLQAREQGNEKQAGTLRDQLWDQVRERVRQLASRYTQGSGHDVDDLLQVAWMKFSAQLGSWKPNHLRRDGNPSAFWPWLNVVLTRAFLDERRRCLCGRGGGCELVVADSGERERRRRDFRVVFQSLRDRGADQDRLRRINCTEQHWLEGMPVALLAQQHGVPLGRVYAWLKEVEAEFGRELVRLYPQYAVWQADCERVVDHGR
jgi:DNA-directed RNA polymerase specialized sigma24 family protein